MNSLTGQLHKVQAELQHLQLQLSVRGDRDSYEGRQEGAGRRREREGHSPAVADLLRQKCVQLELDLKVSKNLPMIAT